MPLWPAVSGFLFKASWHSWDHNLLHRIVNILLHYLVNSWTMIPYSISPHIFREMLISEIVLNYSSSFSSPPRKSRHLLQISIRGYLLYPQDNSQDVPQLVQGPETHVVHFIGHSTKSRGWTGSGSLGSLLLKLKVDWSSWKRPDLPFCPAFRAWAESHKPLLHEGNREFSQCLSLFLFRLLRLLF